MSKKAKVSHRLLPYNPVREYVQGLDQVDDVISLSIGDPTVGGVFEVCDLLTNAFVTVVSSHKFNGYTHSAGLPSFRHEISRRD